MKKVLLLVALCGFFIAGNGQDEVRLKRAYTATGIAAPPQIDGILNDSAWSMADWEGDFQMYEPYDDRKPTQETRFKVVFDRENIYVGIRAFDTAPDSIVRRLTRRDDIDGDMVAFQFDSYHDLQTAFTFFITASGSIADIFQSNDGDDEDETWNPVWWAQTHIDEKGWTAEAMIPFTQLRFDPNSSSTWGFQVAREIFRHSETSLWQPMSREDPGWIHLIGELHGLENIDPRKQAEITPYMVLGNEWFEKDPENPYLANGRDPIFNAGLDAKIGLSNNFTLDLTVNPDFGQVEADPSEVNLTAFESYFEEQRPFFIEGKNIFDFDLAVQSMGNLFYSRRIGRRPHHEPELEDNEYADLPEFTRILGAAKVSGKTRKGLSVGVMESVTSCSMAEINSDGEIREESIEPMTNYFAGSVSREFDKGNTVLGAMVTSTNRINDEEHLDYLHKSAYSGGVNFSQFFSNRDYVFNANVGVSQVNGSTEALVRTQRSSVHLFQRPDASHLTLDSTRTSLAGYSAGISGGKQGGNFQVMGFLNMSSPGLELNDIGFLTRTDQIFQILWMGYRFNEPRGIIRRASLNVNQWNGWDFGGNHVVFGGNFNGYTQFTNLWELGYFVGSESDAISNTALRGGPSIIFPGDVSYSVWIESPSTKKLAGEIDWFATHGFEDSYKRYGLDFELEYKPISNLSLSLVPEFSIRESELQYIDQEEFGDEYRYIFGRIEQQTVSLSFRINLVINPRLTIQYWGQPFIASGDYSAFKRITDPHADVFNDRYHIYGDDEISYNEAEDRYQVSEADGGLSYGFDNPDFNVKEFLSNLVFRWEYRPGSYIYLVWSQNRSGSDPYGRFSFRNDFNDLWDIHPSDVLLLKFSYRIGR